MELRRLENALDYVAGCIAAGDDSLLPIFERLESELSALSKRESALERARRLAQKKEATYAQV